VHRILWEKTNFDWEQVSFGVFRSSRIPLLQQCLGLWEGYVSENSYDAGFRPCFSTWPAQLPDIILKRVERWAFIVRFKGVRDIKSASDCHSVAHTNASRCRCAHASLVVAKANPWGSAELAQSEMGKPGQ